MQAVAPRSSVSSGVPSLDNIIEGGFNEGDIILVAGQPGAGKTTLGMEFLVKGVTVKNENGVYASFVESAQKLKRDMLRFGWDLEGLEREGRIKVLDMVNMIVEKGTSVNLEYVMKEVAQLKAKRLVVDSLSAMTTYIQSPAESRSFVMVMNRMLEKARCTSIFTLEVPWGRTQIGAGFEEFISDGLIVLESRAEQATVRRRMFIPKMRGVNHSLQCYEFYITKEGIDISTLPGTKG